MYAQKKRKKDPQHVRKTFAVELGHGGLLSYAENRGCIYITTYTKESDLVNHCSQIVGQIPPLWMVITMKRR
jgi:hypothetical protein